MRVISCISTKGGSGKSTLAACIAAVAAEAGIAVAVVDTDPQASLDGWVRRREARGTRDIVHDGVKPAGIADHVDKLRREGFVQLVIIDTPGIAGAGANSAASVSDLVLIPVKPTLTDMTAVQNTVAPLRLIGSQFAFVVSQVPGAALDRARKAARALLDVGGAGSVAGAFTGFRVGYDDAMAAGMGPTEYDPRGAAADEVRALWDWIDQKSGELHAKA